MITLTFWSKSKRKPLLFSPHALANPNSLLNSIIIHRCTSGSDNPQAEF